MVCKEYHKERTIPLIETVGKEIIKSGDEYFLLGSTLMEDCPRLLKLSQKDCYFSLVEKSLKSLEYHYLVNTPFDWYFIGDDDTFVNVKNLNLFLNSIETQNHPTDYYVIGSTRHPDGTENAINGEVCIKGGSGILMNKATFQVIREINSCFQMKARRWAIQDSTFDLLINLHNSNNIYDFKKQIVYLNCFEFFGDRNKVDDDKIHKAITIHNKFYSYFGHDKKPKTMYDLMADSNKEIPLFTYSYEHLFSPSPEYLKKIKAGEYSWT